MSRQSVMRRNILALLAYPRKVAKGKVDLSHCPHSGLHKALDARCTECSTSYECEWLNSTDQFNDLAVKSMEYLYRALTFGIDYIDAQDEIATHDRTSCHCDACNWVRGARYISLEYVEWSTRGAAAQNQEDRQ